MNDLPNNPSQPQDDKKEEVIVPAPGAPPPEPPPGIPPPAQLKNPEEISLKKPPKRLSKKQIILASVGVFFLLASIPLAVYLTQQRQEIREKATVTCGGITGGEMATKVLTLQGWSEGSGSNPAETNKYLKIDQFPQENGIYLFKFASFMDNQGPLPQGIYRWAEYSPNYVNTDNCNYGNGFLAYDGFCGCDKNCRHDFTVQKTQGGIYVINLNDLFNKFNGGKVGGTLIVKTFVGKDKDEDKDDCRDNLKVRFVSGTIPSLSPTPTPPITVKCEYVKIYETDWKEVAEPFLKPDQNYYLATKGSATNNQKITKARFRITVDGQVGAWQETTIKNQNGEFYITYTFGKSGKYKIEAMVYNQNSGWK